MKRIHFITILFLLILPCMGYAQERGDGSAQGSEKEKDPNGIISGRNSKGGINGYHSRNRWFSKNNEQSSAPGAYYHNPEPGITDFGVKAGANFQEMATSPFTTKYTPGIVGGLYCTRYYGFTALKIELLGSSAHYISREPSVVNSRFSDIYLSVPVLFQLRIYRTLYFEIGPQYSYLLSSSDKNGDYSKAYGKDNIFFKSEFSGVAGIEALLPYKLKVEARYIKGLTDVNNSMYPQAYLQWTINSIQAMVSYRLY